MANLPQERVPAVPTQSVLGVWMIPWFRAWRPAQGLGACDEGTRAEMEAMQRRQTLRAAGCNAAWDKSQEKRPHRPDLRPPVLGRD